MNEEHLDFTKDMVKLLLSFTVISGLIQLYKVMDKWVIRRIRLGLSL